MSGELAACFANLVAEGYVTDKGTTHSYIPWYEELLAPYRLLPVAILEIGVYAGASVRLWRDYFVNGTVYGIERAPEYAGHIPGVRVIFGDATRPETWAGIDGLDIVIDDGSHHTDDIVWAFRAGSPLVYPGGFWIIEDIQSDAVIERLAAEATFEVVDRRNIGHSDDRLCIWRPA